MWSKAMRGAVGAMGSEIHSNSFIISHYKYVLSKKKCYLSVTGFVLFLPLKKKKKVMFLKVSQKENTLNFFHKYSPKHVCTELRSEGMSTTSADIHSTRWTLIEAHLVSTKCAFSFFFPPANSTPPPNHWCLHWKINWH